MSIRRTLTLALLLTATPLLADAPRSSAPSWVLAGRPPAGQSLVIVHNASGRTLFGNRYVVQFDHRKVARLARGEFTAVVLPPGEHRGGVNGSRGERFSTEPDRVTHWVVAYSPERSIVAPFGGRSLTTAPVSEEVGRGLLQEQTWVEPLVPLVETAATDTGTAAGERLSP